MMNQEEDQMFLLSQPNPSLFYSSTTTPLLQGEEESRSSRSRRRKKNKIEANDEVSFRKRKLSDEQVRQLEINFGNEHKLESERKDKIASELGLDPRQVAVWFQNRRVRWKTKKLEEEYSKLQMIHEGVVLEKCRLESEVMKLKEEILKAENEKKKISERRNDEGVHSSGSPSSSSGFSIDAADSSILIQEFGGGFDNFFYVPEENNYNNVYGMEWVDNLYGL